MSNSYPVEYKGTAFGDPARSATMDRAPAVNATANAAHSAKALQQTGTRSMDVVTISAEARQLSSQPASYKGTAFGDPI